MSTLTEATRLYKIELLRQQKKNKRELEQLQKRITGLYISKSVILQTLNKEIRTMKSIIRNKRETIETHDTLIRETEDGTLDNMDYD